MTDLVRWLLGPESYHYDDQALGIELTRMAIEMAKWPVAILCALTALVLTS